MANLNSIIMPEDSGILRDVPGGEGTDTEDFLNAYDRHTLFYDVFYDEDAGVVRMIGPSFKRRLSIFLKRANFKIDGEPANHRLVPVSPRTGMVEVECASKDPQKIRLLHKRMPRAFRPSAIGRTDLGRFEGKNALVAISKNNDLQWIRDWLAYYVAEHGANAVVLFDNGSDAYRFRELRRAVSHVQGIEQAAVISAPFPFGPRGTTRMTINSKFFHLSMIHIAHLRFLARANAVLSVDIDELVNKPNGVPVFDAVKNTESGFVSITGSWRYAMKPSEEGVKVRHVDHKYRRIGPDTPMNPKWCVDPQGPLQGRYWRVHGIAGAERDHSLGYEYIHCRQITTNWDYDRAFEPEDRFERAPEAETLETVFS